MTQRTGFCSFCHTRRASQNSQPSPHAHSFCAFSYMWINDCIHKCWRCRMVGQCHGCTLALCSCMFPIRWWYMLISLPWQGYKTSVTERIKSLRCSTLDLKTYLSVSEARLHSNERDILSKLYTRTETRSLEILRGLVSRIANKPLEFHLSCVSVVIAANCALSLIKRLYGTTKLCHLPQSRLELFGQVSAHSYRVHLKFRTS